MNLLVSVMVSYSIILLIFINSFTGGLFLVSSVGRFAICIGRMALVEVVP